MDMYARSATSVRAPVGDTDLFPVEVGLHQGSALSLFLFAVVLDELSKSIQEILPWGMIFADDIVLVAERKQDLNMRLEEWRTALERKGLRISSSKTEYLHCDFGGANDNEDIQITIEGQVVPQVTKFKYLGSFVQNDGELDSDVALRLQVGWCRWRAATDSDSGDEAIFSAIREAAGLLVELYESSQPRTRRPHLQRDRVDAHDRLMKDYVSPDANFDSE
ncbi:uncharacterized protein LOC143560516 [Bidens hawaiensis]|uniref:uncharacterized protein LOC143560516 n=1 Tax=Bidens hawaiensis TaxID=980011 RepID=UPI00404A0BD0